MPKKRIIEVDDFEYRIIIKSLSNQRNDYLKKGRSIDDVSKVLLKIIDAPTRSEKHRKKRNER